MSTNLLDPVALFEDLEISPTGYHDVPIEPYIHDYDSIDLDSALLLLHMQHNKRVLFYKGGEIRFKTNNLSGWVSHIYWSYPESCEGLYGGYHEYSIETVEPFYSALSFAQNQIDLALESLARKQQSWV